MRKVLLAAAIASLATALTAAPAMASAPSHHHFSTAAAEAFWESKVPLSSSSFELTVWDVGVFSFNGHTSSFLFKQVADCHVVSGHTRCRLVSFSEGQQSLSASQFSLDRRHLDAAHLAATYLLHVFRPHKPRTTMRVRFVTSWTGTGKILRDRGTSTFHSPCFSFHTTFKDRNRHAIATGSASGKSLGTARQAFLSTGTSLSITRTCTS